MLSPNTLCGNIKNFGGKNYREENSKTKQANHLFFSRIGTWEANHWWESKDKRIEQNGLSHSRIIEQANRYFPERRRDIAGTQTAGQQPKSGSEKLLLLSRWKGENPVNSCRLQGCLSCIVVHTRGKLICRFWKARQAKQLRKRQSLI